jgi:hypothetical protein
LWRDLVARLEECFTAKLSFTKYRAVLAAALLTTLQIAPTAAIAALASYDLTGVARPTTSFAAGALQGDATMPLAAPTGLTITVIR